MLSRLASTSSTRPVMTGGPQLVVVPNVGIAIAGERAYLDIKATEGLRLYANLWPGPVLCIGRAAAAGSFGYGIWYERANLPFSIACVGADAGADEIAPLCKDAALVLGGADSHLDLGLVNRLAPTPVVLIIEYTLKTRFDMLRVEQRSALAETQDRAVAAAYRAAASPLASQRGGDPSERDARVQRLPPRGSRRPALFRYAADA